MVFSCRAYDYNIVVWDEALLKTQSASWHTLTNYSAYRMRRQRLPISSEIAPLAE